MLSLPVIWQTNHRPIIQTISALLGDLDNNGGTAAGVGLCLRGPLPLIVVTVAQIVGKSDW